MNLLTIRSESSKGYVKYFPRYTINTKCNHLLEFTLQPVCNHYDSTYTLLKQINQAICIVFPLEIWLNGSFMFYVFMFDSFVTFVLE